jgi:hypothetical protein
MQLNMSVNAPLSRLLMITAPVLLLNSVSSEQCHYGMPKHTCRNLQLGESLFCRIVSALLFVRLVSLADVTMIL